MKLTVILISALVLLCLLLAAEARGKRRGNGNRSDGGRSQSGSGGRSRSKSGSASTSEEDVCCGVPPCGDFTIRREEVNETSFEALETITYTCAAGHVIQGSDATSGDITCEVTCTWTDLPICELPVSTCPASALPSLANADFLPRDVTVGDTLTYICRPNSRLSPDADPTSLERIQTTTCLANGTFTPLAQTCVFLRPETCRDFFTRDNTFANAATTCQTVTIDPEGPDIADPNNPPALTVQCCKDSGSTFSTMVSPSSGGEILGVSGCTGVVSEVLPNTVFPDDSGAASKTCDTATNVSYPLDEGQIIAMISAAGSCEQTTIIVCQLADGLALALRVNGEPSGVIYGTNAFAVRGDIENATGSGPIAGNIELSNYAYTGAACDCARTSLVPLAAEPMCVDGCQCTSQGPGVPFGSDMITKQLTVSSPAFVMSLQLTQHDVPTDSLPQSNTISVFVGPIQCSEIF